MNSPDEQNRRRNIEKINFATHEMSESAQFTIAVAVGIFGILTLFVMINPYDTAQKQELTLGNSVWTKGWWSAVFRTILSMHIGD